MKKILVVILLVNVNVFAQTGIGTTTPEQSAQLDVSSTTKGFLPPRMTASQRNNIGNPAQGLIIFCTDCASGEGELQIRLISSWKNISGGDVNDPTPTAQGYYFHGGNQSYPFAQAADGLTAANPGTMYYDDGGGNAFASTTDLSVAMSYIMDNMGATYSPGNYTVSLFSIPNAGITALGSSDALNFGAMNDGGGEFYYIILPDGNVDLTSTNPQHLVDGGISTNAVQKASFTWNGDVYWLYRLGGGSQTVARTITFSDND